MIGKKTLKQNEVNSINEYFDLIIESKINGQIPQAKDYLKKCNAEQKQDFFKYLEFETALSKEDKISFLRLLF